MGSKDMSKAFKEIAELHSKYDVPSKPCPDQWIEAIGTSKEVRHSINELPSDGRRLVLILESPHKKEYDTTNEPKGPASGVTGNNICRHLDTALKQVGIEFENVTDFRLVLINAIQYQCSLGELGGNFTNRRDDIFRELFLQRQDFSKDFIDRIRNLRLDDDDIVINCCTKGNTKGKGYLRDLVCQKLRQEINRKHYHLTHPSSWPRGIPKNDRKCPYP